MPRNILLNSLNRFGRFSGNSTRHYHLSAPLPIGENALFLGSKAARAIPTHRPPLSTTRGLKTEPHPSASSSTNTITQSENESSESLSAESSTQSDRLVPIAEEFRDLPQAPKAQEETGNPDDTQHDLSQQIDSEVGEAQTPAATSALLPTNSPFHHLKPEEASLAWDIYDGLTDQQKKDLTIADYNYVLGALQTLAPRTALVLSHQQQLFATVMERAERAHPDLAQEWPRLRGQWWDSVIEKSQSPSAEPSTADSATAEPANPFRPTATTFTIMIRALASRRHPSLAEQLLNRMLLWGLSADVIIYTVLMNGFYHLDPTKANRVTRLFASMVERDIKPDQLAYFMVIRSCTMANRLSLAISYFEEMVNQEGLSPTPVILACLAEAYLRIGDTRLAQKYMSQIGEMRNRADEVAVVHLWSTLFLKTRVTLTDAQIETLFIQMLRAGVYPSKTVLSTLDLEPFRLLTLMTQEKVPIQPQTFTTLLYSLLKRRDFGQGLRLLKYMKTHGIPATSYFYNALIDAFIHTGQLSPAMGLYDEMIAQDITPNQATYSMLITGVARDGNLDGARRLLMIMRETIQVAPELPLYNTILLHCGRLGRSKLALELYRDLIALGLRPTAKTFEYTIAALSRHRPENSHSSTSSGSGPHNAPTASTLAEQVWGLYRELQSLAVQPTSTTYQLIIPIMCRGDQFNRAWQAWEAMLRQYHHKSDPHHLADQEGPSQTMSPSQLSLPTERLLPNVSVCNYLMICAEEIKDTERVLQIWNVMNSLGVVPNPISFKVFLACCQRANLVQTAQLNMAALLTRDRSQWNLGTANLVQFAAILAADQQWADLLQLVRDWGKFGMLMDARQVKSLMALAKGHPEPVQFMKDVATIIQTSYPEVFES
ncbi:hypothetical protein BJ085DRAFT_35923 [Dimargaris cristalligena]|uniref:Pentacotripeptide-repeat region of PRORP domain-containing protein n=1 Tax=Dimargaris cristalligena TaxID=215637 RepID=A0A4P9ZUF0_9FUNG|nr:hypothetical protein BJ085DRAFT_35923 [Dimargaris cristalligena]|eukprot:RKP36220.1 hypothetical protein BJ085DRAFT_35923 [Dimargaris cristalligena]